MGEAESCVMTVSRSNGIADAQTGSIVEEQDGLNLVNKKRISSSSSSPPWMECDSRPKVLKKPRISLSKKRVSWDRIQTREYALVVGDHPLCQDGLPVSLDWKFNDSCPNSMIQTFDSNERKQSYAFPRRLSYEERRQRLCMVSGLSDEQVKNDEIDLVVRTLKESWDDIAVEPCEIEPLAETALWDDVLGNDASIDLGDISNFEWTD